MLEEICVGFLVLGISAYAVFGSADFGAGFWDLTAGGAARGGRVRGHGPALDEPGVGGQPRLADLRARDRVDGVPGRVRVAHVDALRPALPRRPRDHLPRDGLRAARPRGHDPRGAHARRGLRPLLRADPVLPRGDARRHRLGPRAGGQRGGRPVVVVAEPDVRRSSACSPWSRAPTSRRSTSPGTPCAPGSPTWRARSAPARSGPAWCRASWPSAALLVAARRTPGRCSTGSPPGPGSPWSPSRRPPGAATLALVWTRRYGLARMTAGPRSLRSPSGGRFAQDPYLLPPRAHARRGGGERRDADRVVGEHRARARRPRASLWWLYRLVLRGTLDQEFEPLDQRFRPCLGGRRGARNRGDERVRTLVAGFAVKTVMRGARPRGPAAARPAGAPAPAPPARGRAARAARAGRSPPVTWPASRSACR